MSPREAVVAAARGWIGTPYHHRARLKGIGVDCAQILVGAYSEAGVIEAFDTGDYPPDMMMHRDDERYVEIILRFADELVLPCSRDWLPGLLKPADVVVWRFGRTFSHGAIVTDWPLVVHAFAADGLVLETDVSKTPLLLELRDGSPRPMRAFRARGIDA